MPKAHSNTVSNRVEAVAAPLANLGWQVMAVGQEHNPPHAVIVAEWIGRKGLMPSVDTMRGNLTDETGMLMEGSEVGEAEGITVVKFDGSPDSLYEFGNRMVRYAGVQLLEEN